MKSSASNLIQIGNFLTLHFFRCLDTGFDGARHRHYGLGNAGKLKQEAEELHQRCCSYFQRQDCGSNCVGYHGLFHLWISCPDARHDNYDGWTSTSFCDVSNGVRQHERAAFVVGSVLPHDPPPWFWATIGLR